MGRTVGELLSSMSSAELVYWFAYHRIEPIGEWRGDYRAGQQMALLFNLNRDPKKATAKLPEDFMPLYREESDGSNDLLRDLKAAAAASDRET